MYLARTDKWYLERMIWLIAGTVVLGGTLLGIFVHKYWFAFPILAGFNMLVFAFTGFCPMAVFLNKVFHVKGMCGREGDAEGAHCCAHR